MVTQAQGGSMFVFADTDTRGRFVASLGFEQSPQIAKITGDAFYAELSPERFDLLDGDGLILLADETAVEGALGATWDRLSASTPPAVPYALDRLVPELRARLS